MHLSFSILKKIPKLTHVKSGVHFERSALLFWGVLLLLILFVGSVSWGGIVFVTTVIFREAQNTAPEPNSTPLSVKKINQVMSTLAAREKELNELMGGETVATTSVPVP